jgi:hypothetical protein
MIEMLLAMTVKLKIYTTMINYSCDCVCKTKSLVRYDTLQRQIFV